MKLFYVQYSTKVRGRTTVAGKTIKARDWNDAAARIENIGRDAGNEIVVRQITVSRENQS